MSDAESLIQSAIEIIGKGDSDYDWKIVPSEHAALYEEKAPTLARNLRGSRTSGIAEMYEDLNDKAMKARDAFKNTVLRANWAVFLTASFGALVVIAGGLHDQLETAGWVARVVSVMGVLSGVFAGMWLKQVKGKNLAEKWAGERARAEAKRLAYFKSVMAGASEENAFDQLLTLEYTRRFLLDNQIDFFRERGEEHQKEADRSLDRSTYAMLAASVCTALAGVASFYSPQFAMIAGVGVIATAYAAMSESRTAINLDRRNADRYRTAEELLKEQKLELDNYRHKTASGDKGAVLEFFEPVFVTLAADHREFLSDQELRETAIGEMEQRLDQAKESLKTKTGGSGEGVENDG